MIGDILRKRIYELENTSIKRTDPDSFWITLRNIAKDEIIALYPNKIDSDIIIDIYYGILLNNIECIPAYFREKLPSNKQERFRVINRNIFSSNAFHTDGLANQEGIIAHKQINENRKGQRIVFQGDPRYVNNK